MFKIDTVAIENNINELRWCDVDPEGQSYQINDAYGASYEISKEEACNIVQQYDMGKSIIKFNHLSVQTAPIAYALEVLGEKTKELKLEKLISLTSKKVDGDSLAEQLSSAGFSAKALMQIAAIKNLAEQNGQNYEELLPYLGDGIKYDVIDELLAYYEGNYNADFYYRYKDKEERKYVIKKRKTTFEDIKGGMAVIVTLSQFSHKLKTKYGTEVDELIGKFRDVVNPLKVSELIDDYANGLLQVGVDPSYFSPGTHGEYFDATDSLLIKSADLIQVQKLISLHESVHALVDRESVIMTDDKNEQLAYCTMGLYHFMLNSADYFKAVQNQRTLRPQMTESLISKLLPRLRATESAKALIKKVLSKFSQSVGKESICTEWVAEMDHILASGKVSDQDQARLREYADQAVNEHISMTLFDKIFGWWLRGAGLAMLKSDGSMNIHVYEMPDVSPDEIKAEMLKETRLSTVSSMHKYYQLNKDKMKLAFHYYTYARTNHIDRPENFDKALQNYLAFIDSYLFVLDQNGDLNKVDEVLDEYKELLTAYNIFPKWNEQNLGINKEIKEDK